MTNLIEEIANMAIAIESDGSPTRQETYNILMRAFVEITMLNNRIRTLEGKQNG